MGLVLVEAGAAVESAAWTGKAGVETSIAASMPPATMELFMTTLPPSKCCERHRATAPQISQLALRINLAVAREGTASALGTGHVDIYPVLPGLQFIQLIEAHTRNSAWKRFDAELISVQ